MQHLAWHLAPTMRPQEQGRASAGCGVWLVGRYMRGGGGSTMPGPPGYCKSRSNKQADSACRRCMRAVSCYESQHKADSETDSALQDALLLPGIAGSEE